MGGGESSHSDFSHPFFLPLTPLSPCLSVPHGFPTVRLPQRALPQVFGSFDQLTLHSTQIASSFSLRKGKFSVTIYFPLITTLSNLISSSFPKICRILFTLQPHCFILASVWLCEWIIFCAQCMHHIYIYMHKKYTTPPFETN